MSNINMKTLGLTTVLSFASLNACFAQKLNQIPSQLTNSVIVSNNNTTKYDTFVKMNKDAKQEGNLALLEKESCNHNCTDGQKYCKEIDEKQNANVKQAKEASTGLVAIFLSIIFGIFGFMYSYEQGRRE